jgi:MOSC domain-containing protein YiiM
MTGRVVAVNLAVVRPSISDKATTGIDKRPTADRVGVGPYGLAGDTIVDLDAHGGLLQAVYAYAEEDAAWWSMELGRALTPGRFGENLTTQSVAVTDAVIGERWQVGGAVLQVTTPRIPCRVFAEFWDLPDLIKRFTARAFPGAYFSVVEPGTVGAGDAIEVIHRPDHGVTIGETFRALTLEPELLPRLLLAAELPETVRERVSRRLSRQSVST